MIASGITSFADMYYFCDDMAEVTLEAGLNLNLSRGTTVFTTLDDPACLCPLSGGHRPGGKVERRQQRSN